MIRSDRVGSVTTITVDRPERRNAIDRSAAAALAAAVRAADADPDTDVLIVTGAGGTFCAGADLKAVASESSVEAPLLTADGDAPLGVGRLHTLKPVIAAIEGFAVAGGLELALWADLRVCSEDATLGVFCRRVGVPLIDGGTVRLPRLIGMGRALDLILTGRPIGASEALSWGLVDRVTLAGGALAAAQDLAAALAAFPQRCLRADLASARAAFDAPTPSALRAEFLRGVPVVTDEGVAGATRFSNGDGRHGRGMEDG
jgi:enoyl-CoA hydratase